MKGSKETDNMEQSVTIDAEKENAKRDWEGWGHHGHHGGNNGHHGGDSGWLQGPEETF